MLARADAGAGVMAWRNGARLSSKHIKGMNRKWHALRPENPRAATSTGTNHAQGTVDSRVCTQEAFGRSSPADGALTCGRSWHSEGSDEGLAARDARRRPAAL